MTEPTTYEIVIKGRASARCLQPLVDDFAIDHTIAGVTRLTGEIRDAAHLHGVVAHLTSVNAELISLVPIEPARSNTPTINSSRTNTSNTNTGKSFIS